MLGACSLFLKALRISKKEATSHPNIHPALFLLVLCIGTRPRCIKICLWTGPTLHSESNQLASLRTFCVGARTLHREHTHPNTHSTRFADPS